MNYNEKDVDKELSVWKIDEVETWVGFNLNEIIIEYKNNTGNDINNSDIKKIPRVKWDSILITSVDEEYSPKYTMSNCIVRELLEGKSLPFILSTTEY